MGTDINFRKHLNRTYGTNVSLAFDPMSSAYFAATGITGATQQQAIDNLVKGLKQDGLWSKMKAVYPFVTDYRNLLSYTEDFSNAFWTLNASSVTANATTAPNGTITADRLTENSANNYHTVYVNNYVFVNGFGSFSIYVKFNGRKYIALGSNNTSFFNAAAIFDISAGTIVSTSFGTSSIESVGNGWYRCSISGATSNGSTPLSLTLVDDSLNALYTGNGTSGVFIWGAQYELTSTVTTYQPQLGSAQAAIASQFKYNLVNPVDSDAAFRLVFNGGWTHSANGATPNGVNAYADTKLNPLGLLTKTSHHISFYSRTQNTANNIWNIGCEQSGADNNSNLSVYFQAVGTKGFLSGGYPANWTSSVSTNTLGLHIGNQTSSTSSKLYQSGVLLNTNTNNNTSVFANLNYYIGAVNNSAVGAASYSIHQAAFSTIGDGLTDTEAANLYKRVQTFNQALSRQVGVPIVSDADAQAFLNSAEITDITQANAINTLVTDLKAQGLWTKMKAVYPFVGGTASTHKWNLKDPRDLDAAYRLVFNGGWTHSSTGATPNGTNAFADTKLSPLSVLAQNNSHMSYYSRTNQANGNFIEMGTESPDFLLWYKAFNITRGNLDGAMDYTPTVTSTQGFLLASKYSTSQGLMQYNGSQQLKTGVSGNTRSVKNIYLAAINSTVAAYYSAKQTAFATIGDGLTDAEALALYNTVNNYQVALSRNV